MGHWPFGGPRVEIFGTDVVSNGLDLTDDLIVLGTYSVYSIRPLEPLEEENPESNIDILRGSR